MGTYWSNDCPIKHKLLHLGANLCDSYLNYIKMKKKAFQYLMILLLGTTAAFADWSEDLNPSINDEAKDSCTYFSEDQATLGKDSSEEEMILGPTDTNDDTSYLEYLDIPFDLFWDLAERFGYINTYALLGEEAAERILEEIRERRTRGRAAKYIAPTVSVAIAIITYTTYLQVINVHRDYNRIVNPPRRAFDQVRVIPAIPWVNQIFRQEPGNAGASTPDLPGLGAGG